MDKLDKDFLKRSRILKELISSEYLDRKELERDRGFLVYISWNYRVMALCMKGIHLTLTEWRSGKDMNGWKVITQRDKSEMDAMFREGEEYQDPMNVEDPRVTYPVRCLKDTIEILELILSDNRPNKILVRLGKTVLVGYGFGDVSSSGFGATFITNNALYFQYRNWSSENSKVSSN